MSDQQQNPNLFSSDRPIESKKQDLLGRVKFAQELSKAIINWKGKDSLVIALYGAWGSGKSSLKNLVIEELNTDAIQPIHIDFNPWQWAGQDQLAQAFFQEIGKALGQIEGKEGKSLLAKWKLYSAYLKMGGWISSRLKKIFSGALLIIGALATQSGFNMNPIYLDILRVVGVITFLAGIAFSFFDELPDRITAILEAKSETREKTLAMLKKQLSEQLRKSTKPILITVDDIDRLSPDQIKLLFQLIKANADFPNMVYLLLFQRNIIEKSLTNEAMDGKEYLEKIIQIGFDIPHLEANRVQKVLFEQLDLILNHSEFDHRRWANIFIPGLRPFFGNLRDVYRYLGTFAFHYGLLKNNRGLEINQIDLIAIETLRVFEPEVYRSIFALKEILTQPRRDGRNNEAENAIKERFTSLINKASEKNRKNVQEILEQLFPHAERFSGNVIYSSDHEEEWQRELRICHPDIFSRYFHLGIPEGDISQEEIDQILSLVGDRQGAFKQLQCLKERGLLDTMMDRLEAFKQLIDPLKAGPFFTALFDIGDELSFDKGGFYGIDPFHHAERIVYWSLRQSGDRTKNGEILKSAIQESEGLYLPISLTADQSKKTEDRNSERFVVNDDAVLEMQKLCIEKIKKAANNGKLQLHPKFAWFLQVWHTWGSADEAKAFVNSLIKKPSGLFKFLMSISSKAKSQTVGEYAVRTRYQINLKNVEDFVAATSIEEELKKIDLTSSSDEEKKIAAAFNKSMKRRRDGFPDGDFMDRDDD